MTSRIAELVFYSLVGKHYSEFSPSGFPDEPASQSLHPEEPEILFLPELLLKMFTNVGIDPEEMVNAGMQTPGWPYFVPASQRGDVGAAQLQAAVSEVVTRLRGLFVPRRVRNSDQPLTDADRRLMQDRPPHHGSVG